MQVPAQSIGNIFDNPEFTKWFLGQSIAFVTVVLCLGLWIWTLLRDAKASRKRNEELSDFLVRHVENDMRERLAMADDSLLRHDSTVRNILGSLGDALDRRRKHLESRSGPSSMTRSGFPDDNG